MKTEHCTLGQANDGQFIATIYEKGQTFVSKEPTKEKAIRFIRDKLFGMIKKRNVEINKLCAEGLIWEEELKK